MRLLRLHHWFISDKNGSINCIGIKMGVLLKEAVLQDAKKFTPKAIVFWK
jgi:hypothetical protein